jgi:hypothetical protein
VLTAYEDVDDGDAYYFLTGKDSELPPASFITDAIIMVAFRTLVIVRSNVAAMLGALFCIA